MACMISFTCQNWNVSKAYYWPHRWKERSILNQDLCWKYQYWFRSIMTSSSGNIFRVTGLLYGTFTDHRWIPLTRDSVVASLMFSLICAWTIGWANDRDAGDLRRYRAHYDVHVIENSHISLGVICFDRPEKYISYCFLHCPERHWVEGRPTIVCELIMRLYFHAAVSSLIVCPRWHICNIICIKGRYLVLTVNCNPEYRNFCPSTKMNYLTKSFREVTKDYETPLSPSAVINYCWRAAKFLQSRHNWLTIVSKLKDRYTN